METAAAEAPVRRWSYRRLLDDNRRAANLFRTLGGNDPRVAMLLPAMPQAYITLLGAETAGLVCPINYLLSDRHIAELLRATHANMLVALGPHPQLDIWSKVGALGRECPELRHVLSVGGASGAPDFDASLAMHRADTLDFDAAADADSVVALFHTGGTTGAPKLARHRHRNQPHASWSAAQMMAMTADDVIVNGFPLFHVAGSFVYGLSALLSGAEVLLPTLLGMRNPDFVRSYWEVVERHRVSLLAAVPTVISTLMEVPVNGARIETVRALFTGGSPLRRSSPPHSKVASEFRCETSSA
ncbi:MAG: AMP-binding protein [Pseudomonadota bacterium]|nr:AMP-binding protein [Pseudomonadota bacterium]